MFAMFSVDLHNANPDQRELFDKHLNGKKWKKVETLSTVWRLRFSKSKHPHEATAQAKKTVAAAAKDASIEEYDAAIMIGNNNLEVWNHKGGISISKPHV